MNGIFDRRAAASYESWYETAEGARADALERAALRRVLKTFDEAGSVLEVGSGTGHFTRWLAEEGWTAIGLDLSEAMLAEAQALDGVPLVQGDANRLPFANGAFDVTALVTTLEFLEDPQTALVEAVRVARQGILLGVLNRYSILALQRRLRGVFRSTVYNRARFYHVRELKHLASKAVVDVDRVDWVTTLFPSWAWRPSPWPWPVARLPWGGFIAMALRGRR